MEVPNFINATLLPQERITAQEIDSYFRRELIHKREERMGKRVKALLEEFPDKGFFFAFGAGEWQATSQTWGLCCFSQGASVEGGPGTWWEQ